MKRRFAFLAMVLGFSVLACQLIIGIDRAKTEERPPDAFEAAPPPPVIPDPCAHVRPPPPPLTDDEPIVDNQLMPFYVALSEFHLVAKADGGALRGFDLDGVCTCDDRPAAAHDGGGSCTGPVKCDPDGGIDNGSTEVFNRFAGTVPDFDKAANINNHIALGEQDTLILISDYNGRANDKSVNVGVVVSNGIYDAGGCGTADPEGGPPPYPAGFCGSDTWTVDPKGVIGDKPPYTATLLAPAYVTNHTLVIDNPKGYFEVPFGAVPLRLYSPIFTATIVPIDANGQPRDPDAPRRASPIASTGSKTACSRAGFRPPASWRSPARSAFRTAPTRTRPARSTCVSPTPSRSWRPCSAPHATLPRANPSTSIRSPPAILFR